MYKRIDKDINLPIEIMQSLFISRFLESINLTIGKIKDDRNDNEGYFKTLNEIKNLLVEIDNFTNENLSIDELINKLSEYAEDTDKIEPNYYLIYELKDAADLLSYDLKDSRDKKIDKIKENYFVTDLLDRVNDLKNNMSKDSLKFTFALRGAIVTSIGVFIVSIFNIEYGKWLVFSLSSIVQPYLEASKVKGKDRLVGTVIGLVIFEILFYLIKENSARVLVILVVGYISNFQTRYKDQMICTTISALGAAAMTSSLEMLSINRIVFVVIGTLIALYANKVILPYKMRDITKKDIEKSIMINEKVLSKLYELGRLDLKIDEDVKEMLFVNNLINKKIDTNNLTLLSNSIDDFLYNQRMFMNDIRFLVNNFRKFSENNTCVMDLVYDVDNLMHRENSKEDIIKCFNKRADKFSQLVLVDVLELKENIINSKKLSKQISNEL
ncbi:FUSC family protein [Paraclostridium bifermentans]|nr:FUSC family protein [Paraclostridium bifermentans]